MPLKLTSMKIYFGIRSFSSFGRTDSQKIFSSLLYLFLEYFLIRQISLFTPKSTTFAWSYLSWNPHARSSIITLLKLHKVTGKTFLFEFKLKFHFFFLTGIHSIESWTAITRHGVTVKRSAKRLKHAWNLFTKNLQLKFILY